MPACADPPASTASVARDGGGSTVEVLAWTAVTAAGLTLLVQTLTAGLGVLACQAAADHALQATRVAGGSTELGATNADTVLDQVAGRVVRDARADVVRTPQVSTVTIRATALPVLPMVRIPLHASASGPTEPDLGVAP